MTTRVLQLSRRRSVRLMQRLCVVVVVVGLGGCVREPAGSPPVRAVEPIAKESTMADESMAPAGGVAAASTVPDDLIRAAIEDAAQRTSARVADITILSAESVTWSDGSLGCPQPGMSYMQALVPGYRIVLQAGEQMLNYHAGTRGRAVFCPAEQVVPPAPGGDERI